MVISKSILHYFSHGKTEPPYEVAQHRHEYWELVYYGGLGVSTVNGVAFNYVPGSYVVIPHNVPHAEKALSCGDLFCLGFEAELEFTELPTSLFVDDERQSIRKALETIETEIKAEPPYYSQRVNLLLRDILLLTLRTCTRKSKKADDKLDMIIRYIDAYCTMDIDFRTLSNSMNYSYDYLRHYFKAKKKMSLKQYIITKRIDLAKEQLTTNMPVSKVAAACGFASPSYFSAVFRQFTGMTPSQYQEHRRRFPNENYTILCEPDG